MEIIFAYLAGVLTLINPCVLPVIPIVLASATGASRYGPVALALGMSVSFVVFGVFVTAFGATIGLTQDLLGQIGAVLLILFGLTLLVPALSRRFEAATAGFSAGADAQMNSLSAGGVKGQFIGGMLLGAVWSPCIGPTLGGAIALASQGQNLFWVTLIMIAFAAGVSTFIIGIGLGTREAIRARATSLRGVAERSKPILGAAFLAVGVMLFFRLHHVLEAGLISAMPIWLQDVSVTF